MAAAEGNRRATAWGWLLWLLWLLWPLWPLWLCMAAPAGAQGDAATLEQGRVLLERYHCGSCHTVPGVAGARGTLAASLAAYGQRSYIAGRVANRPDVLASWIVAPEAIVPGTAMPNMGVSPTDARAMAAYLGSLR